MIRTTSRKSNCVFSSTLDGAVNTSLLLKFLECEEDEKANELPQVDKNNSNDLNSKNRMSIVDLVQNTKESY